MTFLDKIKYIIAEWQLFLHFRQNFYNTGITL